MKQSLSYSTAAPASRGCYSAFTASRRKLAGQRRPWEIAISYGRDRRLASLMLEALEADGKLVVGDNEPYPVDDAIDYTIPVHGEGRGLPHVLIEIRQDGIATSADAAAWAVRLAATYAQVEPAALRLCGTSRR
jgi:predicted N-formylglutamate amidohydrolase